jgi:hypothetical protein
MPQPMPCQPSYARVSPCAIPTPAGARHSLQGGRCALGLLTTDAVNFVVFFLPDVAVAGCFWQKRGGHWLAAICASTYHLRAVLSNLYSTEREYMGEHQVI